MKTFLTTVAAAALISTAAAALDSPVRIVTGMYSGKGGLNTARSTQMAMDDFGGEVLGQPIGVLSADRQNKPDVRPALAQRFIDERGVTMMALRGSSAVGRAAQGRTGKGVIDKLLVEVKIPDETTGPTDLYDVIGMIAGNSLFLSAADSGSPMTAN